jgi:hypothetical protein
MWLRGSRPMGVGASLCRLVHRNLKAFRTRLPLWHGRRALRKLGSSVSIRVSIRIWALDRRDRIMFERQGRLEIGSRGTVAADTVGTEAAGYLATPFRFDGQVIPRGSGDTARHGRAPRRIKRSVTKTADLRRFAIHGAAMQAGFYHRSVLRCGCLAERKSGVGNILAAARSAE